MYARPSHAHTTHARTHAHAQAPRTDTKTTHGHDTVTSLVLCGALVLAAATEFPIRSICAQNSVQRSHMTMQAASSVPLPASADGAADAVGSAFASPMANATAVLVCSPPPVDSATLALPAVMLDPAPTLLNCRSSGGWRYTCEPMLPSSASGGVTKPTTDVRVRVGAAGAGSGSGATIVTETSAGTVGLWSSSGAVGHWSSSGSSATGADGTRAGSGAGAGAAADDDEPSSGGGVDFGACGTEAGAGALGPLVAGASVAGRCFCTSRPQAAACTVEAA